MSQRKFNIYFILSLVFFTIMFVLAVLDGERKLVDNPGFLFLLIVSLLNMAHAVHWFCKPIDNYYQDQEEK